MSKPRRRIRAILPTLVIVALALLPAFGAIFTLGTALAQIEKMKARGERAKAIAMNGKPKPGEVVLVGSYEVDPQTMEGAIRMRHATVER